MKKQVGLRPQAEADRVKAARYETQQGRPELAERRFGAALAALQPIERMPAMGSPRLRQL